MIPGVTDRSRLPRLGKVRLGEKAQTDSGTEYPKALDHFNFKDAPELAELFPGEVSEFGPIVLPHDDEETFMVSGRFAYSRSGLFCKCTDGKMARRVKREKDAQGAIFLQKAGEVVKDGDFFTLPCPAEMCPYWKKKSCKNLARFLFMVPDVPKLGVFEIATTSINTIINVLSMARVVKGLTNGKVTGIPFFLVLKPQEVEPEGKKKTVYVVDMEYRGNIYSLANDGRKLADEGIQALALPAADDVPDDLYPDGGDRLEKELKENGQPKRASETNGEPPPAFIEHEVLPPIVTGMIETVKQRKYKNSVIHTIHMDGQDYKTTSEAVAEYARQTINNKKRVKIAYETQANGVRRIEEIAEHKS
jgi:hypothetical protein